MKLFYLNFNKNNIIQSAGNGDRKAQKELYDIYSPKILSICRQYIKDDFIAEDLMIQSCLKIFNELKTLKNIDSFEFWIRRLTINNCLSHLRSRKVSFEIEENMATTESFEQKLFVDDIQEMIDQLPLGCKTVFNLYVVDGYQHHEIAEMLNITPGTSKSQLSYARKLLKDIISKENKTQYNG